MAAKKKKTQIQLRAEKAAAKRQKLAATKLRAFDLYGKKWKQVRIAEELSVSVHCINRWLRESGRTQPLKVTQAEREAVAAVEGVGGDEDDYDEEEEEEEDGDDDELSDGTAELMKHLDARLEENEAIAEIAENQTSPADRYQAYVASSAIKLLRDNLMNVRGPRTIRELSELDQLIRRSLGLNPKGGGSGGSGSMSIDISILNNTKASKGPVVDVEVGGPYDEE